MDTNQTSEQTPTAKKTSPLKSFHLTPKQQKIWLLALSTFAIITILGGIYLLGYKNGHAEGEKQGRARGAAVANPLANLQNPFNSTTGKVTEIKDDSITVDTNKGEKKTIKLDDKTKVTRKTETVDRSEIKNGQKVTIFARGEGDDTTATRIVLRD